MRKEAFLISVIVNRFIPHFRHQRLRADPFALGLRQPVEALTKLAPTSSRDPVVQHHHQHGRLTINMLLSFAYIAQSQGSHSIPTKIALRLIAQIFNDLPLNIWRVVR